MASLNIIQAAGNAYQTVWRERFYLLRMAIFPVLVKLACYIFALALGWEENILRLSLCLIPAYFLEGWFLAHLVRLIVLGQRWPLRLSGNDEADRVLLAERTRGIMGGLLAYVLMNVAMAGYLSLMLHFGPQNADPQTVDSQQVLIAFAALFFSFWAFRLLWLHIPLAVNASPLDYLKKLGGYMASAPLIGVWFLCFIPPVALMLTGSALILVPFAQGEDGAIPPLAYFTATILRVVLDTLKAVLCTAGIAYAIKQLYDRADT